MIATLRETWTSVRNPNYGQEIIKKTVGQAFWYWLKYVLLVSLILSGLAIALLTYFVPQVPKAAARHLPNISLTLADGQLSTTASGPLKYGGTNFTFILDTAGSPEDADLFASGVLILKDRIIVKDATQTQIVRLAEIASEELRLDKATVVSWLQNNKLTLLLIGLGMVIVSATTTLGVYLVWQWIAFLIGSLAILVAGLITNRKINFSNALKLVIFAAVPALFGSLFHPTVSLGLWAFFAIIWLLKLPVAKTK